MIAIRDCAYTGSRRRMLELIFKHGPITRKQLATITGFSNLTVAKIIKSMLEDGTVIEADFELSEKGRRPLLLSMNPDFAYSIGVDIGAHAVKIGVVNFRGELLEKEYCQGPEELEIPVKALGYEELIGRLDMLVGRYGAERLLGIGVGISGLVDYAAQTIVYSANISGYNNLPIARLLIQRYGVPAAVDTSARCMALGEKYLGECGFDGDLSFVSVGYSIAAAAIINNEIFRGSGGFAGELGHVKVGGVHGGLCSCGSVGCVESSLVPLPLLKMELVNRLNDFNGYSLLKAKLDETGSIELVDIAEAARAGDKMALDVLGDALDNLSVVLSDYINLFNPQLMVLGGGFFDLFPFILPELKLKISKNCLTPSHQCLRIELSSLSRKGAIIGSALQPMVRMFF